LHHVVLERWSRRSSPLHRRDARAKVLALLVFLIAVATTPPGAWWRYAAYAAAVLGAVLLSGLPVMQILRRAALVLPFSATFGLFLWIAGSRGVAMAVVAKSLLSAVGVILAVGVTPMPAFLRAVEWLRVPGLIVLIAQFVYRYLFVISEEAQHMRAAMQARGGGRWRGFSSPASAVSVLFAKSYARAEGVHRAMIARGFTGSFPALAPEHWHSADWAFLALASLMMAAIRVAG
jgi:cobalt/nickel transport system permease protein